MSPKNNDEWVEEFIEYCNDGYSGGKEGLRCTECYQKYRGESAMIQLCPVCKVHILLTEKDKEREEVIADIIKMADVLELECGKDGDKGTKQWMAFKGFRNTIRDKYLTPNHQD